MALSHNTPPGSVIRCIRDDDIGRVYAGDVYTLLRWERPYHEDRLSDRWFRIDEDKAAQDVAFWELVSLPEEEDGPVV